MTSGLASRSKSNSASASVMSRRRSRSVRRWSRIGFMPTPPLVSRSIPPLQHPQRAERVPAAGCAEPFQFEVGPALPAVLQRPAAILPPGAPDDLDRLGKTRVGRRVDGLEIIESAEDVVVPPR